VLPSSIIAVDSRGYGLLVVLQIAFY